MQMLAPAFPQLFVPDRSREQRLEHFFQPRQAGALAPAPTAFNALALSFCAKMAELSGDILELDSGVGLLLRFGHSFIPSKLSADFSSPCRETCGGRCGDFRPGGTVVEIDEENSAPVRDERRNRTLASGFARGVTSSAPVMAVRSRDLVRAHSILSTPIDRIRINRINAHQRRLRQHVPLDRLAHVRAGEAAVDRDTGEVDGE